MKSTKQNGSIELVVLGLLGALIMVLAFPLLSTIVGGEEQAEKQQAKRVQVQQPQEKQQQHLHSTVETGKPSK